MFDILPALVFLVAMAPRRSTRAGFRPKAADGTELAKQVVQKRNVKNKKKSDDVSKNKAANPNQKCTNASTSKSLSSSDESDDEILLRQLGGKSTNTNVTKRNVTFAEENIVHTFNNKS